MNTAADVKLESDSEQTLVDRRPSMKLVGAGVKPAKKNPIKITVSNEIFSLPVPSRRIAPGRLPDAAERRLKRRPESARNVESEGDSSLKLVTVTTGIALLGAVVIGYFIGRSRD